MIGTTIGKNLVNLDFRVKNKDGKSMDHCFMKVYSCSLNKNVYLSAQNSAQERVLASVSILN